MLAAIDYRWWVFLHILGVLAFLLSHGVSAGVALRLRRERDRMRIFELLQFSGSSLTGMYVGLGLLLLGGVIAAFQSHLWGGWWIWASLILLLLLVAEMIVVARPYYQRVKAAVELRPSGVPRKSDEELDELLSSPMPMVNTAIGFVALAVIVWLMVFKPGL